MARFDLGTVTGAYGVGSEGPQLEFRKQFLSTAQALSLFAVLRRDIVWQRESVHLFGKKHQVPRLIAWYGDPGCRYRYSGIDHQPLPWLTPMRQLNQLIGRVCGTRFNSVLANLYRDGKDGMGWHSDNEPELGETPAIASLSLGETRLMRFRHKQRLASSLGLDLRSGDLLVMRGETQRDWQHSIPKSQRAIGERINLTFRRIVA